MNGARLSAIVLLVLLPLPAVVRGGEGPPVAVSPGGRGEAVPLAGPCPTFTWAAASDARGLELMAYRLTGENPPGAGTVRAVERVWRVALPRGARAWMPGREQCFAPGRYAWLVRTTGTVRGSESSEPLLFEVPAPSAAEVREAITVLERYLAREEPASAPGGPSAVPWPDFPRPGGASPSIASGAGPAGTAVVTGSAALRAELADTTGEAYGVVGLSNSLEGAGLAAENTAGGADLLIAGDGSSPGARLTESGLDRMSDSDQTFGFENSGSGGMTLQVDGIDVVTSATDQDSLAALGCAGDEIARWSGAAWECSTDQDSLAALGCAGDEIARWNGAAWECSTDLDTLDSLGCAASQVAQWSGSEWVCSSVGTDTLGSLSCTANQVVHWNGAAWTCGQPPLTRLTCSNTGSPANCTMSCAAGSIVWAGGCEAALADSLTDNTPTQTGGVPTGWRCEAWDPLGSATVNGELYCVAQ